MNRYTVLAASLITGLSIAGLSSAALAETYTVKMKFNDDTGDFYFEPANLKIQPGDTVVWIQDDPDNEHNVAAYPDKIPAGTEPFVSPLTDKPGDTWSQTFTKVGSYFYHCHPHEAAGMRGLVVVGRQSLPEEFRRPKPGEMKHDHGGGGDGDGDMKHGEHMMDDGTMMKDGDMKHGEHMMDDGTMMKDGDMKHGEHMMDDGTMMKDGEMMMDHGDGQGEKHGQSQMKDKMKKKMMDKMDDDDDGHGGDHHHD